SPSRCEGAHEPRKGACAPSGVPGKRRVTALTSQIPAAVQRFGAGASCSAEGEIVAGGEEATGGGAGRPRNQATAARSEKDRATSLASALVGATFPTGGKATSGWRCPEPSSARKGRWWPGANSGAVCA